MGQKTDLGNVRGNLLISKHGFYPNLNTLKPASLDDVSLFAKNGDHQNGQSKTQIPKTIMTSCGEFGDATIIPLPKKKVMKSFIA